MASGVEHDSTPVGVMALSLPSLIGALLPPSYGFAMIDEDGKVQEAWPKVSPKDTPANLLKSLA